MFSKVYYLTHKENIQYVECKLIKTKQTLTPNLQYRKLVRTSKDIEPFPKLYTD